MLEPQQARDATTDGAPSQTLRPNTTPAPSLNGGALDLFADDDDLIEPQKARPPWWRRKWTIAISALVLVALLGYLGFNFLSARNQRITYQQQSLRQGTLILSVSATGPVQGASYSATFSTSGRVAEIDVKLGQKVESGQQLAKLDTSALDDAFRQAQAQFNQAWWTLQNALWNCDNQKSSPPNCKDAAYASYDSAKLQFQTAQDNLKNATLNAPHAGIVTVISGAVGGSSSGGTGGFIQIADTSALQVVANINEADIGNVVVGQPAIFTTSAYGALQFKAAVSLISPAAVTTSNVVSYPVTLDVDMTTLQNKNLLPGMTATVTITRARRDNVVLLPATALSFARSAVSFGASSTPTTTTTSATNAASAPHITAQAARDAIAQARQTMDTLLKDKPDLQNDTLQPAFVLQLVNRRWSLKPVVIGLTDGTNYEVLSGLASGDQIVTGQSGGATTTTSSAAGGFPLGGGRGTGGSGGAGGGRTTGR